MKARRQLSELKKTVAYLQRLLVGRSARFRYVLCKVLVHLNCLVCEARYARLRRAVRCTEAGDGCDRVLFANDRKRSVAKLLDEDRVFVYSNGCWRLITIEFENLADAKFAFLSHRLHFNIFSAANAGGQTKQNWFLYRPIFRPRVEKASSVHVSPIRNRLSTQLVAKYADEAFRNFFRNAAATATTAVRVTKNDCLRIETDEFATFVNACQWTSNEFLVAHVYYRVTGVRDATGNQTNIVCEVDPDATALVQECGSQSFVYYEPEPVPEFFHELHTRIAKGLRCFLTPATFRQSIENVKPIFLLSGARGSGKRFLLRNLSEHLGFHCYQFECASMHASSVEQAHVELKTLFVNLRLSTPCILLLNDFEQFARNTDNNIEYRLVDAFEKELEQIFQKNYLAYPLIVFAAVRDRKSLPADLTRLFLDTFSMPHFDAADRRRALRWLIRARDLQPQSDAVLDSIAAKAYGFNLSDLRNVIAKAKTCDNRTLTDANLAQAFAAVQKTYSESIGAPKVPRVHWDDIGGLEHIKDEILRTINLPMRFQGCFRSGSFRRSGILLHGPPGTGKTLIAKAVATENNFCFLSVKGPELLNMYVGQSEKNIREIFAKARQASPCIIFFDELDSLVPKRGHLGDSSGVMDRLSSQMLTEMDQLNNGDKFVFVIGATNRLDLIDTAFLRPGRFDKVLYVGVCNDTESKVKILTALLKRFNMDLNARDLVAIADRCPRKVSGADLYSICSNAWMSAVRRQIIDNRDPDATITVTVSDFEDALLSFNNK